MKKVIIVLTIISIMNRASVQAAEVPKESLPCNATEEQIIVTERLVGHIFDEVINLSLIHIYADIAPVSYKGNQSCAFCDYREVCHFDRQCGSRVRKLDELPKEEIWKEMEKAGETHA